MVCKARGSLCGHRPVEVLARLSPRDGCSYGPRWLPGRSGATDVGPGIGALWSMVLSDLENHEVQQMQVAGAADLSAFRTAIATGSPTPTCKSASPTGETRRPQTPSGRPSRRITVPIRAVGPAPPQPRAGDPKYFVP